MEITDTAIADVKIICVRRYADQRGFFSETYNRRALADAGIDLDFVQDNHSLSIPKGVVRGLHYQAKPFVQDKLIRVTRGAIWDVALDVRRGSTTFGQHVAFNLDANGWQQAFVPAGFAHGFVTLEPNTEVLYKVTRHYSAKHDRGILWDDPALGIDWPVLRSDAIVSDKDRQLPILAEAVDLFD